MPNADWKKCAVWTALPTTQTRESQPDTGNGSREASYSTSPTSCRSWSRSRSARRSSSFRVCSRLICARLLVLAGAGGPEHTPAAACWASGTTTAAGSGGSAWAETRLDWADCVAVDTLDVALLTALHDHPRAGDLELSRLLGVAPGPVTARPHPLGDAGVVTGHGPDVAVAAAGFGVQAFVTLEIAQGAI